MPVQLALIQDEAIKKSIITVSVDQLTLSRFNPRTTRPDEDIDKLANRIVRNGFEITRALWAYRNGSGYEVFAGGTRLEAAKRAGLNEVPAVLHEGLTDEDIVRLAEEDNANDEYHQSVSPVDTWAHYAWLSDQGWTQEKIAQAKGLKAHAMVSYRIKLHAMPNKIKDFVSQDLLTEGHLTEIMQLSVDLHFSDWLTTEQAWLELAEKAVKDKSKNGKKTVKAVKEDVDTWKAFIQEAEVIFESLPKETTLYDLEKDPPEAFDFLPKEAFINELIDREARSLNKVKEAGRSIRRYIKINLEEYETYIREQSREASKKALQDQREKELLDRFILGDCLEVVDTFEDGSIKLLLLDSPYGKEYQSNRRWRTKAPEKIQGDTQSEATELLRQAIQKAIPKLADNAHILVFCDWQIEPNFRQALESNGLRLKGSLIWAKEEHSAGDVKGAFGPSHERIIHAVKGSPAVSPRIRDVLDFARSKETGHPTEKPVELLKTLINSTTHEGDLIVDLFAGCASTLIAAMRLEREFLGTEIDPNYHDEGCARLLKELNNAAVSRV